LQCRAGDQDDDEDDEIEDEDPSAPTLLHKTLQVLAVMMYSLNDTSAALRSRALRFAKEQLRDVAEDDEVGVEIDFESLPEAILKHRTDGWPSPRIFVSAPSEGKVAADMLAMNAQWQGTQSPSADYTWPAFCVQFLNGAHSYPSQRPGVVRRGADWDKPTRGLVFARDKIHVSTLFRGVKWIHDIPEEIGGTRSCSRRAWRRCGREPSPTCPRAWRSTRSWRAARC